MSVVRISLDAMGGDGGVASVAAGISHYVGNSTDCVFFDLFGNSDHISSELKKFRISKDIYKIHHTEKTVTGDMKPSSALRYGRGSSMFESITSVADGNSDAIISAGNTGAYMALSKAIVKTVDSIDRPALVSFFPGFNGKKTIMLDLGANTDCSPENLKQFAIMGNAVAKSVLGIGSPKVAILNVGSEKIKGNECVKQAYDLIKSISCINFIGFVEGTDIWAGPADVIVTDGFSGNIAIKSMEGTMKFIAELYGRYIKSSALGKISYIFSKNAVEHIAKSIDPRLYNGAVLVGLNGIAIKSHGNADAIGFANAISVAVQYVKAGFLRDIKNELGKQ